MSGRGDRQMAYQRVGSGGARAVCCIAGRAIPGQAVIELALFLAFFLTLSFGVFEFGRAFQAQIVVIQAAREGARVGTDPTTSEATIRAAAIEAAQPYTLTSVNVTFPAGQVQVIASYRFTSDISVLWFIDDFDINASVVGRRV